jgi:hypothetical protein
MNTHPYKFMIAWASQALLITSAIAKGLMRKLKHETIKA